MKRLFHHLLLFCILAATAVAQDPVPVGTWGPVGDTPVQNARLATVANGFLYVLHYIGPSPSPTGTAYFAISRWDGLSWEYVMTLPFRGNITAFMEYRGELYLAGKDLEGPGTTGMVRWDGSQWRSLETGAQGGLRIEEWADVSALTQFNGTLVIAGHFREVGKTIWNQGIAQWDGTHWKLLYSDPALAMTVNRMKADGNRLYAAGSSVFEWDGTRWSDIATDIRDSRKRLFYQITIYQGSLYAVTGSDVFQRQGNTWQKILSGTWTVQPGPTFAEHNGALFFSGSFSDRTVAEVRQNPMQWDGSQWQKLPAFNNFIEFFIEYDGSLYVGGMFTHSGQTPLPGMARFYHQGNSAIISGKIFHDIHPDCTRDLDEPGIAGRIVEVLPGQFYATTDEQGKYVCYVPPGNYTIAPAPVLYWSASCNQGEHSVELEGIGSLASGKDFPVVSEPDIQDVRVSIASIRGRPGFKIDYTITYENIGTAPASGTLRLFHDPILTFRSATPVTARYNTGMAEWDFLDLPVGASRSIQISLDVPPTTPLDTRLCARAEITLQATPAPGVDFDDSSCVNVTGSFDPNDIQVTPDGTNGDGVLATTDSVLTYTIRFQNTGTDTAFKVVVIDTLAAQHAPASIRLGAASHPYSFTLTGSGVMTWTFADIMLPDSNINEAASHGYLKYSVHIRPGLAPGTEIPNRASIYFDFNEPVITNTVVSILPKIAGIGITEANAVRHLIYPNPSYGPLTIQTSAPEGSVIKVQNLLGQPVMLHRVAGNTGIIALDLSSLPAGTYTIRVPLEDGGSTAEKIVLVR